MDRRTLKRLLHRLAARRIGHEVDLWPRIEARLAQPAAPHTARRVSRRAAWVAATLLISLLIGTGVYAFHRLDILYPLRDVDRGLDQAISDDLVTEIGLSHTLDGVTARVEWAYADAHRITVAYSVSGESDRPVTQFIPLPHLWDQQGREFQKPMLGGGGGGSGGGGGGPAGGPITMTYVWGASFTDSYDAALIETSPATLPLRFAVEFVITQGAPDTGNPFQPGIAPRQTAVGPFEFEFEVPFIPAVEFAPGQTVMAGDIALTLAQVSVTPSLTQTRLCFAAPNDRRHWQPVASLDTGEEIIGDMGRLGIVPPGESEGCVALGFLAPYRRESARWTLTVERLQALDPAGQIAAVVEGPWVFTVELPGG